MNELKYDNSITQGRLSVTHLPMITALAQASSQELEAAIAAQKLEIQRLFRMKDFDHMPEAQRELHRLLRAKADLRHKRLA